MSRYDADTIGSHNPFVRYAHRVRLKRSLEFAAPRITSGKLLDYGCGSGAFIARLNSIKPDCAVGYEPFLRERPSENVPIYDRYEDVRQLGPYQTVTLFETIEHLTADEVEEFLHRCDEVLESKGSILVSAPVEIGPALLLKEASRAIQKTHKPRYQSLELFKAALFGIPGRRADKIKSSHKGYDFRESLHLLRSRGWKVAVLGYSPLPMRHWYGNSQVFFMASKSGHPH